MRVQNYLFSLTRQNFSPILFPILYLFKTATNKTEDKGHGKTPPVQDILRKPYTQRTKVPVNIMTSSTIQHPPLADALRRGVPARSKMLNVVRLYTLLYKALLGWSHPMPRLPYPGIMARLTARLARPVVLAERLFFHDGFLIPYFIILPPLKIICMQTYGFSGAPVKPCV